MSTNAATAVQKYDKLTIARRWAGLKNKLSKMKEVGAEMGGRAIQGLATVSTFGALFYWRRRRELADKRVTFDEAGKVDAFFWPGLVATIAGITPLLGDAGRYVVSVGSAAMCVGSVGFIDKMAVEHHNKA